MSTYIIDRLPNRFGGQQQAYVEAVNVIVKNAAGAFLSAVQSKQDIMQLFHHTLASFGKDRSRIAKTSGTKSSDLFGARRDRNESSFSSFMITPLGRSPYSEYNKRLLPFIQKQMKKMKYDLYEFQQAESNISFSPRLGRRSMMEFSILPGDTLQKWPALFTEEEYRRICGICEVPPNDKDELDIHEKFTLLTNNKGIVQKLKEKSLKDYQILKLFNIIHTLREDFPDERKSDWVHVTTRSEINDKMVDHSDYFTWMYRDFRTDPVNRMTGRSIVSIIHQDSFLIEPMLDDIAQIFKTAIEWSGEKIKDLKDQMALFRYELSHAMPFERGSSAIAEWFERAIYLFHGMDITYTPDKMVDLEALTSSLKDFVDNYETMIQLDSTTEAMCAVNN